LGDFAITADRPGHSERKSNVSLLFLSVPDTDQGDARLVAMVRTHFDTIWRALRRHGLPPDVADDAAQQVFVVASRRLSDIAPEAERSFLLQTALRIAAEKRRAFARRRETSAGAPIDETVADSAPNPEEEAHRRRSLALLDEIIGSLDEKLQTPFVLFEIEGLEIKEIAAVLDIPIGTVGSRLRLAREEFQAAAKRVRARQEKGQ
jgi:RNA polymerase sigma-70 factor (ECF subfamily)